MSGVLNAAAGWASPAEVQDLGAFAVQLTRQPGIDVAAVRAVARRTGTRRRVHDLVWHTVDLAVGGPEDLMPGHNVGDGRQGGVDVPGATQFGRERDMVTTSGRPPGRRTSCALGRRQRRQARAPSPVGAAVRGGRTRRASGPSRWAASIATVDSSKTSLTPMSRPKVLPHRRSEFRGEQGGPPVRRTSRPRPPGHVRAVLEQLGQPAFGCHRTVRGTVRRRSRAAMPTDPDLAVRVDRDLGSTTYPAGTPCTRQKQPPPWPRIRSTSALSDGSSGRRREIPDQAAARSGQLADHHDGLAHTGSTRSRRPRRRVRCESRGS